MATRKKTATKKTEEKVVTAPAEETAASNPRVFNADDLNGSDKATGSVTHQEEPVTYNADDVTNEATGDATQEFPDHDEKDFPHAGNVTVSKTVSASSKSEAETPVTAESK